jgi:colanic acid biosynthesis glycosyl transferase WcaI
MLTQWYDPEPGPAALPGALARELASRGHSVQVLTGYPNYPTGQVAAGYKIRWREDERHEDIAVRRVALYPSHGKSVPGRLANYASFGASSMLWGAGAFKDVDAVWISNSPVTVGLPMWRLARLGKPTLLHVLDLWPDNIMSSGLIQRSKSATLAENAIHRWNRSQYGWADYVAAIAPGVVGLLRDRGVPDEKLRYIPMWADESRFFPADGRAYRSQLGVPDDRVVVLYAGTLGGTQAIDTLVRACSSYPEEGPPLECWIAGSGVSESELRRLADEIGTSRVRVRFLGRIPMDDMAAVMGAADVHYVGLRDDSLSRITMPSKIQATMASGKPMIVALEGDARRVVLDAGAGIAADPGSAASVADALLRAATLGRVGLNELGAHAREAYVNEYSVHAGANQIEDLLNRACRAKEQR